MASDDSSTTRGRATTSSSSSQTAHMRAHERLRDDLEAGSSTSTSNSTSAVEQADSRSGWAEYRPWTYSAELSQAELELDLDAVVRAQTRTDPTGTQDIRGAYAGAAWARYARAIQRLEDDIQARVRAAQPSDAGRTGSDVAAHLQAVLEDEGLAPRADANTRADSSDLPWWVVAIDAAYLRGVQTTHADLGGSAQTLAAPAQRLSHPGHRSTRGADLDRQRGLWRALQRDLTASVRRTVTGVVEAGESARTALAATKERVAREGLYRGGLIAESEVSRTFNRAYLQEAANANVKQVTGIAEYRTAGDGNVCPQCAALEGLTVSVTAAGGRIPIHPRCRCRWSVKMKR